MENNNVSFSDQFTYYIYEDPDLDILHYKIDEIINEIENHGLIEANEKKEGYFSYIYNYILQYIKLFKDKFL